MRVLVTGHRGYIGSVLTPLQPSGAIDAEIRAVYKAGKATGFLPATDPAATTVYKGQLP